MGLSSRLPLLLLLSVLHKAMCTEQRDLVSYVRMDYVIHGSFSEKMIVNNLKQCPDRADRNDSFGFVLEREYGNGAFNYSCRILKEFHFLEKRNNSDYPWYYLQDKSSNNQCKDGPFPVSQVLQDRGQCDQKNDPKCQQLKDLDIHCKAVNTTGCTLSCGENEIRKAPDFTFCCPAYEKENGQKACCPDGERVIPGAKECCATITLPKGKQVCCPKKTFPGNDKNGIELCCPEKESCCPEGQEIATSSAEGVAICCPKGMTVIDGTSKCCLNDFDYTDVFGKCVGVVNFDRIPTSTKELMQLCADKKSSPVKIENEDQNKYLRGGKFRNALIGLAIPDDQEWAEDGFRWLVDGSKPTFVNWVAEEPNNGDGMSDEIERFVLLHNKGSKWKDVSSTDIEPFIICMAEAHEGSEY